MTNDADLLAPDELDPAAIRAVCGDISDAAVVAIIETGGTLADLQTAAEWAYGDGDDVLATHPLTGPAAEIFDLLKSEEPPEEEP